MSVLFVICYDTVACMYDIPLPLVPQEPEDDDGTKRKSSSFKLNTIAGNADSPKIGIHIAKSVSIVLKARRSY